MNTPTTSSLLTPRPFYVGTELPVFIADLSPAQAELDLARQALDELRITHPESPSSNVKATYMSPWTSHLLNPKLGPLTNIVAGVGREASKTLSADLNSLNMDLVVTDCWGIIYDKSSYTQVHNHFPVEFACSIYLEAHPDSAPLIFAGKLSIQPTPGMLIMFPGILNHEVPVTAGRRVVIAMNLNKRALFERLINPASPDTAAILEGLTRVNQ
jgi:hypothetical protein